MPEGIEMMKRSLALDEHMKKHRIVSDYTGHYESDYDSRIDIRDSQKHINNNFIKYCTLCFSLYKGKLSLTRMIMIGLRGISKDERFLHLLTIRVFIISLWQNSDVLIRCKNGNSKTKIGLGGW